MMDLLDLLNDLEKAIKAQDFSQALLILRLELRPALQAWIKLERAKGLS